MIKLTRPPARIAEQGTFPIPGLDARFSVGRDVVAEAVPEIMRTPGVLAVDIEGAGKDGRKRFDVKAVIVGHSHHSWIFDPRDPYQFELIRRILNGGEYRLAFHNSNYDVPILFAIGLLDLEKIDDVLDTLLWARLAEPDEKTRKTLTNAAANHLGIQIANPLPGMLKALGISTSAWYETKDLDVPAYRIMAASDAVLTHRLVPAARNAAFRRLTEGHPFSSYGLKGAEADDLTMREQIINRMFLKRACKGFRIDPDYLDAYVQKTTAQLNETEDRLEAYGIRPGVSADLVGWMEREGHLPANYPRTKKTKKPSGDKKHLGTLSHPLAVEFVKHKEVTHILNDYLSKVLDNADEFGRIHPVVNILGAATGRMSISGDAPLHQFSEDARGIIIADDFEKCEPLTHHVTEPCNCKNPRGMVSIDWSQIEPVIVANVAGDRKAVEYYEAGNKFYNALVEFGGISYKAAKVTLLAQLYGEGIAKLAADLRVPVEEAEQIKNMIWNVLPGTRRLVDKAHKGGKLQGIAQQYKLVFTLSGRIVPVPAGWWPCWNDHETQAEIDMCSRCNNRGLSYSVATHKGVNYFVQGSAYDLLAESCIAIKKAGLEDALYLPMHDELVVDHEAAYDIRRIMETPPDRLIHLAKRTPKLRTDMAHLGERWAAA